MFCPFLFFSFCFTTFILKFFHFALFVLKLLCFLRNIITPNNLTTIENSCVRKYFKGKKLLQPVRHKQNIVNVYDIS